MALFGATIVVVVVVFAVVVVDFVVVVVDIVVIVAVVVVVVVNVVVVAQLVVSSHTIFSFCQSINANLRLLKAVVKFLWWGEVGWVGWGGWVVGWFAHSLSCPTQLQCWGCVVLLLGL